MLLTQVIVLGKPPLGLIKGTVISEKNIDMTKVLACSINPTGTYALHYHT